MSIEVLWQYFVIGKKYLSYPTNCFEKNRLDLESENIS